MLFCALQDGISRERNCWTAVPVPCREAPVGVELTSCLTIQLTRIHTQLLLLCCVSQIVCVSF